MEKQAEQWKPLTSWASGNQALVEAVQASAHVRYVTNGHVLFSTGDPTGDVCFVLSGRFSIIRYSVKGYEVRLSTLGPGEWVGEMAALSAQPRSAFVIAAKDSTVATISKGKFLNLMQTNGHFATKIAQLLSARLNEASQRMFEFAASNSEDRVYSEVFRLSAPAVRPEIRTIEPAPSVTEIAARLSMARETASRAISRLEKMRLLDRQAHVWQVTVPSEIAHNTR